MAPEHTNNEKAAYELQHHADFPYSIKELQKLKLRHLEFIIGGCINTYGSREILKAFKKEEYLSLMIGSYQIKLDDSFKKDIRAKRTAEDEAKRISIDEGFGKVIEYADNITYARGWKPTCQKAEISDELSGERGERQKRITQIPEQEKKYFLNSFFKYKIITIDDVCTPEHEFFDYRMSSKNRQEHANIAYELLKDKWNNKDEKPESHKK